MNNHQHCYFAHLFLFFLLVHTTLSTFRLKEQFNWNVLDFVYPSEYIRAHAIVGNQFIPENNLPVGIEIWKDKIFVTVPRWREGVPSTLNYIPRDNAQTKSPKLIPYPDLESNALGNCESGLTTVYRIKADACDRLWVLDTGTFGIENTTQPLCPNSLNVFDLTTNKKIRRYQLPPEDTTSNTFIANIAVDLGRSCEDTFAYMSDELGYGLIVYSWKENRSWRFSHSYFMPDPLAGDFKIGGLNFQWGREGIFGLSLSPRVADFERVLYFSPLASNRGFAVSTKVLQNSSRVADSYHDFVALPERGPLSHVTAQVTSEDGIQLLNLIDRNAIGCWNSAKPYGPNNIGIVDRDDIELIFPSDIKIDKTGYVWVLSNRMSNFLVSTLNYTDVNFRIFNAPLNVLIAGTVCDETTYQNLNYVRLSPTDLNQNKYVLINS